MYFVVRFEVLAEFLGENVIRCDFLRPSAVTWTSLSVNFEIRAVYLEVVMLTVHCNFAK